MPQSDSPREERLTLPDLGLGEVPVLLTVWHVQRGQQVTMGDRLVEVVAGSASIDLPAPISGVVVELLADEDEQIHVGQALARLRGEPE